MITKYNDFLEESPEKWEIYDYKWINGKLNCSQNVHLNEESLSKIPFLFGKIDGTFTCSNNYNITSLKGCPSYVKFDFSCIGNKITNLKYCPKYVGGHFNCANNMLTSLKYCPKYVGGHFNCSFNNLNSIEDYPLCIIENGIVNEFHFNEIYKLVKNNVDLFKPLLEDKVKFHQMVMRLNPDLIQYYSTIQPPIKKSIL